MYMTKRKPYMKRFKELKNHEEHSGTFLRLETELQKLNSILEGFKGRNSLKNLSKKKLENLIDRIFRGTLDPRQIYSALIAEGLQGKIDRGKLIDLFQLISRISRLHNRLQKSSFTERDLINLIVNRLKK